MLNQSFSAENFKTLSDLENRKGSNVNSLFFDNVKLKLDTVKNVVQKIRTFRQMNAFPYDATKQKTYDSLLEEKKIAKEDVENTLIQELKNVSKVVARKGFSIQYSKSMGPKGKPVYTIGDRPADFYSVKQVSRNINRIYKVKQANKNLICSQVASLLADDFPYHVIRTDISTFYESINQNVLLTKLKNDQLLSETSLRLIDGLLRRYCVLSNSQSVGVPRGIGISAYLAELFMRDFDKTIRSGKDVVYYARYVDDIIVMFAPSSRSDTSRYKSWLTEILEKQNLVLNAAKTKEFLTKNVSWDFEYLGYKYLKNNNKVEVSLSNSKFNKYKARLRACFRAYEKEYSSNRKSAYRKLLKRIKFLTGNTRLSHSKKNAFVGVFFGSPHLTNLQQLTSLDHLKNQLSMRSSISVSLRSKLALLSFRDGYDQITFNSFKRDADFKHVVEAWKYVE